MQSAFLRRFVFQHGSFRCYRVTVETTPPQDAVKSRRRNKVLLAACTVETKYSDHATDKARYARWKITSARIGATNVRRNRAGDALRIIVKRKIILRATIGIDSFHNFIGYWNQWRAITFSS